MELSDALITSGERLKIPKDKEKAEKADSDDPDQLVCSLCRFTPYEGA